MTTDLQRQLFWFCFVIILFAVPGNAQTKWRVPTLTELSARNQLAQSTTSLSAGETAVLRKVTAHAIAACLADPGPGDPHTAAGLFGDLRIKRVSLSNGGARGLIVQGSDVCMCGATGNCDFWLLDETSGEPKLVLHAIGIQSFEVTKSLTLDRFNVVTRGHSSATQSWLQKFVFDGNRYRRTSCALMDYMDNSTMEALKTPTVAETPCGP
jgi:hypothetical protein